MKNEKAISKQSKSSFYYAFNLLGKEKSEAMNTIYAFCRLTDDIVDEQNEIEVKENQLNEWENELKIAIKSKNSKKQLLNNFASIMEKYSIDESIPLDLIKGMRDDIKINRYDSFAKLETYCYCAASTVGLMSIEVFGYSDSRIKDYAINLGKALQLTNILRDVKKDVELDRIYFPLEILKKYDISEEDIINKKFSTNYKNAANELYEITLDYFSKAEMNLLIEERKNMFPAIAMGKIYFKLLQKLKKNDFNVFNNDLKVSKFQKISTTLFSILKYKLFY